MGIVFEVACNSQGTLRHPSFDREERIDFLFAVDDFHHRQPSVWSCQQNGLEPTLLPFKSSPF